MEQYAPYLSYIFVGLLVIVLLRLIFKFKIKTIVTLILNVLIGGIILYLINYIPGIDITIDIFKSIIVGSFGVPGVIFILIYHFFVER